MEQSDIRLLRIDQVLEKVPVGRSSLYRMIRAGEFPEPSKRDGMSFWSGSEVDNWILRLLGTRPQRNNSDLV